MRSRNPDGPWNPERPVEVSPKEYERQVLDWLRQARGDLTDFEIGHLKKLVGASGEYEFDVVATFSAFEGAEFVVLVECKRYREAVKRDTVMTLHTKLIEVGAHKGMMFSTGGFQRGAIQFAAEHGIALVTFKDGKTTYETKWRGPIVEPPSWIDLPRFVGERLTIEEVEGRRRWRVHTLRDGDVRAIDEFLTGS